MKFNKIMSIMEWMSKYSISEFTLTNDNIKLDLKCNVNQIINDTKTQNNNIISNEQINNQTLVNNNNKKNNVITSPIVGNLYLTPNPNSQPFIKVGDKITADTIICIIEAMKIMNEIKANKSGIIKEILIQNGQPVEYGQPILTFE